MTWLARIGTLVLAVAVLALAPLPGSGAGPAQARCPSGEKAAAVAEALKAGKNLEDGKDGYIILFRHAEKAFGSGCAGISLTARGVEQAELIGKSLGPAFADKVSEILHSPCLRTATTAGLISDAAGWRGVTVIPEARLEDRSPLADLPAVMGDAKLAGRNAVIVAHSTEINELLKPDWLTCGEAAVISRQEDGAFECRARLMPEEWNASRPSRIYWTNCSGKNQAERRRR